MSSIDSRVWITFDLIEDWISKCISDREVELKTFTVDDVVGKAENFCSNIVRISATFLSDSKSSSLQTQNFVVKSSLSDASFEPSNEQFNFFPKEIVVYENILPKMAELLLSIGDTTRIAPRFVVSVHPFQQLCLIF